MIGNETDAATALHGGGIYVGEGHTRIVYRVGDVAYKVNVVSWDYNIEEYDCGEAYRAATPANIVIPDMTLYHIGDRTVLAMPYIDGVPVSECFSRYNIECADSTHASCLDDKMAQTLTRFNFDATSYGNVILKDGIYYMVDLGA